MSLQSNLFLILGQQNLKQHSTLQSTSLYTSLILYWSVFLSFIALHELKGFCFMI